MRSSPAASSRTPGSSTLVLGGIDTAIWRVGDLLAGAQAVEHRGDAGAVVAVVWPRGGDVTDGCAWPECSHFDPRQGVSDGEAGNHGDAETGGDERLDGLAGSVAGGAILEGEFLTALGADTVGAGLPAGRISSSGLRRRVRR